MKGHPVNPASTIRLHANDDVLIATQQLLPGTLIEASPHDACDTEGNAPMPSSRVMATCAAGGNNRCLIGWRSKPSGPGAIRGDSGPKRSGWC